MLNTHEIAARDLAEYLTTFRFQKLSYHDQCYYLVAAGFDEIGGGCFKTTFAHEEMDIVVKLVPKGAWMGALESVNYTKAPEHVKPMLLPILATDDETYQIQQYLHEGNSHECEAECAADCPVYDIGFDLYGGADSKNHRHWHDSGLPVIYDYGQSVQWKGEERKAA